MTVLGFNMFQPYLNTNRLDIQPTMILMILSAHTGLTSNKIDRVLDSTTTISQFILKPIWWNLGVPYSQPYLYLLLNIMMVTETI
jgi:hypothetical protein